MQVTFEEALNSEAAARIYLRSKEVSASEKGELIAKYGEEIVDSTKYEIDDVSYDSAKQVGEDKAKNKTGYDGGKSGRAVGDAIMSVGANTAAQLGGNFVASMGGFIDGTLGAAEASSSSVIKNLGDIATAVTTSLVAARYYIAKPYKDQREAAIELMNSVLPDSQEILYETQEAMEEAAENVLELTEEAEEKNEEANKKMQEDKTLFDFNRHQYDALKAKKDSGAELTPDEKSMMESLTPTMKQLGEDITATKETTSEEVNGIYDTIGEYQDVYDDSAESIAEVEGVTDYAEGFDENTRTMMYVEAAAQGINAGFATVAAARLWSKAGFSFGTLTPFAVMASAAALASGKAVTEQFAWAKDMSDEIHMRRDVQDIGVETSDLYGENFDNYADNKDFVEGLELEVPKKLEIPTETTPEISQSMMSMSAENEASENNKQSNRVGHTDNNDPNKKKEEEK